MTPLVSVLLLTALAPAAPAPLEPKQGAAAPAQATDDGLRASASADHGSGDPKPEAGSPEPAPVLHPLRLALTSTSAFGVSHGKFFNQLLGARLDYRFGRRFAFGAALAYANLKGKDRRVHNALPEVSTEYRVPLQKESLGLPLRLALGFLPQNGPTLRLSAGFDFALGDSMSFELLPLEPMVWINRERPEVSLNGSLALRVAL
jgi:hypothetical protein